MFVGAIVRALATLDAVEADVAFPVREAVTVLNVGEDVVSSNCPGEYTEAIFEPL